MAGTAQGENVEHFFESFQGEGCWGEIAPAHRPADVKAETKRLLDPAAAVETIHWGRNYIYAANLEAPSGPLPVVVKQFKNQGWWLRLERRIKGSKAERSWKVAKEFLKAGLPTPEPVLFAESDDPEGPSFFVARRLVGCVEVRQFFRRLNDDPEAEEFPKVEEIAFLKRLGRLARRIHDAGILYRDLSMGNILALSGERDLELYLVDFNRARLNRKPGVYRRTRDICRLPVLTTDHRAAFLEGYWGKTPSRSSIRWLLYAASVDGYIFKHAMKRRARGLRFGRRHAHTSSHHPHIPAPETGASARDKAVWDRLSDQPHQHASRGEKWAIRIGDGPGHIRDFAIVAASAPQVRRRYTELKKNLYAKSKKFTGIGIAIRPWPEAPDDHIEALSALGIGPVLLRIHPWEGDHRSEERLAAELVARGHELAFAIPQNRDLVRDRARWRAAVEEIAERFSPYGRHFQVGQAINRSKWGIWTRGEYVGLYMEAAEILRRYDNVEVLGPSVIDFELQVVLALVNRSTPGLEFDVVSSLLYVDRRGAPENRQMGLDTVDKVTLLRAIAEIGRNSSERCWITEVNWPLWEGPHSPAGKTVSVGEEEQANYLTRYYLLALGTGLVERVYWWRLIARGYGLITPEKDGGLRRRPAWSALRTLVSQLEGAEFRGPLATRDGSFLYRFTRDGSEVVVGWSLAPGARETLERPAVEIIGRDGQLLPTTGSSEVSLGPAPVYFRLA
jgi:tRNA A-37 threonylcarbamoyl transferase component Bud32